MTLIRVNWDDTAYVAYFMADFKAVDGKSPYFVQRCNLLLMTLLATFLCGRNGYWQGRSPGRTSPSRSVHFAFNHASWHWVYHFKSGAADLSVAVSWWEAPEIFVASPETAIDVCKNPLFKNWSGHRAQGNALLGHQSGDLGYALARHRNRIILMPQQ